MNGFAKSGAYAKNLRRWWSTGEVEIRPARPEDLDSVLRMHERLSSNTLFLRYLVPYVPGPVPGHLRDVLNRPVEEGEVLVAVQGAEVIGLGYYVVRSNRPDTAEPALLIEDRFQGQGIGGRLLAQLIHAAQARGIQYFDAMAHASNGPMLHLLRRSGDPTHTERDGSVLTMLVALDDDG